jgi:hypothetical protein
MLKQLGIVIGSDTKAGAIFEQLFPDFLTISYQSPSDYVNICWQTYQKIADKNSNLNGKIFEYILATLCVREGILPLYFKCKSSFCTQCHIRLDVLLRRAWPHMLER